MPPLPHLPATPHLHWGAETLWQQLAPLLPGLSVEVVARAASTNTELLERARRLNLPRGEAHSRLGEPDSAAGTERRPGRRHADTQPCLLVAEHQTRGRGRQGKAWLSSAGASLTFSLALPLAPADWSGLSLAVGLALADALDPPQPGQPPRLGIKWPNDLLLLARGAAGVGSTSAHSTAPTTSATTADAIGRKVGGILIETVQVGERRMAVVGVGLNLLPQPLPPPDADADADADPAAGDASPSATRLSWGYACLQELQYGITAPAALARVAPALVQALLAFERDGFAPLRARFAARDVLLGRRVSTSLPTLPAGVADGVDDTGTLWLRVGDQRLPVASGELSLRADTDGSTPLAPAC